MSRTGFARLVARLLSRSAPPRVDTSPNTPPDSAPDAPPPTRQHQPPPVLSDLLDCIRLGPVAPETLSWAAELEREAAPPPSPPTNAPDPNSADGDQASFSSSDTHDFSYTHAETHDSTYTYADAEIDKFLNAFRVFLRRVTRYAERVEDLALARVVVVRDVSGGWYWFVESLEE